MPSSHLILCRPLLLLPSVFTSIRVFSSESVLCIRWSKYWSFSFSISPSNVHPRTDLLQNGLCGSPCSPRDSQESSPTPWFKSINSSALSFLYSPTLTSICVQYSSVAQSCPTLCDPMNRSMPGLPVHQQLPEFTQTHIHRVSEAIQPSHSVVPFSSCSQSLPASESFPMSQLFT